jgi:hypothetical protein
MGALRRHQSATGYSRSGLISFRNFSFPRIKIAAGHAEQESAPRKPAICLHNFLCFDFALSI